MRARVAISFVAQIALIAAASSAIAGPLDPPTHRLRVALFEPAAGKRQPLKLTMAVTPSQDWGAIVIASVERKGKRRLLHDGEGSWYIEARRGGIYPSVAIDGTEQLPSCPAVVLCSTPVFPPDVEAPLDVTTVHFNPSGTDRSFYVFLNDVDVAFTVGAGWRMKYLQGGSLMQFRDTGTEVRVTVPYHQYMIEDFHGVTAPRATGPSVAFATIPCWFPPVPGGSGRAVLRDDGDVSDVLRTMRCDIGKFAAIGASDRPTVWQNDGASLGWSGGVVNRLVVAVLPPK